MKRITNYISFLLPALFLMAGCFAQGTSKVLVPYRVKDLWGFADTSGNLKVSAVYKSVEPSYYYNGEEKKTYARYVVKKTTAAYVLDENMLVKVPETYAYDSIHASVLYAMKDRYQVYKAGKTGLFANGKQLISCQYDIIDPTLNDSYIVEKDGLKGLVNSSGKLIVPVKYQSIHKDHYADEENGEITWIARGMIATERFTDKLLPGEDDYGNIIGIEEAVNAVVAERSDPYTAQKTELRKQYDALRILPGREKYVYIEKDGKTGLYDLQKKEVLMEPLYDDLYECSPRYGSEPEHFRFLQNGLFGVIDIKNQVLLPAEYQSVQQSRLGYSLEKDGKKGMYIFSRKLLIPAVYESIENYSYISLPDRDDAFVLFRVKTAGGYGYVGENGVRFFRE